MRRWIPALAIVLGIVALTAYLHVLGKSPFSDLAARHMREMKDRSFAPDSVKDATFEELAALPTGLTVAEYSGIERRAVRLEGYVQRLLRAADNDLHLEVAAEFRPPGAAHLPYLTAEITPSWQRGSDTWRFDPLLAAFRPNQGGETPWDGGTQRVRLTGWLLYDYEYGSRRNARMSHWEIHPVTRIELWDEPLARFVEFTR